MCVYIYIIIKKNIKKVILIDDSIESKWVKIIDEIKCNASCVSNTLKWFAHGPRDVVMSFTGYIINGLRFHTKEAKKSRQNSGVLVEAITLCRSSARDNTQILGQVAYYGSRITKKLIEASQGPGKKRAFKLLKPKNVTNVGDWNEFVKQRTSEEFKVSNTKLLQKVNNILLSLISFYYFVY
ncbi:hypothetical protein ACOSQ2_016327 [Xanthoceras sorbifolium]